MDSTPNAEWASENLQPRRGVGFSGWKITKRNISGGRSGDGSS